MMRTFSSTLTQEHLKKNKKRRMKMPRSIWMICSLVQATRIHPIRIKRSICSPSTTSSRSRKKKKRTTLIRSLSVSQTLSHLPMLMQSQMSQLSRQNSFQTLCLTRSSNNSRWWCNRYRTRTWCKMSWLKPCKSNSKQIWPCSSSSSLWPGKIKWICNQTLSWPILRWTQEWITTHSSSSHHSRTWHRIKVHNLSRLLTSSTEYRRTLWAPYMN